MNQDSINPILFGLVAGVITYLILYVDVNYENKKIKPSTNEDGKCQCPSLYVTLKVPLMIGALVWATASYFDKNETDVSDVFVNSSTSLFDQDVFTDLSDF